jgi:hypothetical protein
LQTPPPSARKAGVLRATEATCSDVSCLPAGDANGDQRVTAADLVGVIAAMAGNPPALGQPDANCDGKVDAEDIQTVIQLLFESTLPLACSPAITLVSANSEGTNSGNASSYAPSTSDDGRLVVFLSTATDLVPGFVDGNGMGGTDVFVRDLAAGTTALVSINSAGTASGDAASSGAEISADGRFIAFYSGADDLVTSDSNGVSDVFVRDLAAGATHLASVNDGGTSSGNGSSYSPALSADGRVVAFSSTASDLVPNDTNNASDIFARDLIAGATTLVSVNAAGTASGNGDSIQLRLSAPGQFIVFQSYASDLTDDDSNGESDVFVRDLTRGITTLASINDAGTASGNSGSFDPRISADGRFVAFVSIASDLVPNDTNNTSDIFVRDLVTGVTTLISVNAAGTASGNGGSFELQISADGRRVAFSSMASDLVPNDTNGAADIFVRDLAAGTTTLASVNLSGTASGNGGSSHPRISADGRFVAFDSTASDLVAGDTNGAADVFVRDLMTGTTTLASKSNASGASGNDQSFLPTDSASQVLSTDGHFIVFEGDATDLVPHDTNDARDVFRFQLH